MLPTLSTLCILSTLSKHIIYVQRYDPETNKWLMVTAMVTRRSSVGAGVVSCLNLERCLDTAA